MAELNVAPNSGRRKTAAPRIDLTPMVDLGFLLITFFMFTTTLAQEKALAVNMPSKEVPTKPPTIPEESTLTLIPTKNHSVIYYKGTLRQAGQLQQCAVNKVTDVVLAMDKEVAVLPADMSAEAHKLHVLIKPMDNCSYDDVVHLLDAMLIVAVPYYALLDIAREEAEMVDLLQQ
jgi:biopolymer transport protein ExbD